MPIAEVLIHAARSIVEALHFCKMKCVIWHERVSLVHGIWPWAHDFGYNNRIAANIAGQYSSYFIRMPSGCKLREIVTKIIWEPTNINGSGRRHVAPAYMESKLVAAVDLGYRAIAKLRCSSCMRYLPFHQHMSLLHP